MATPSNGLGFRLPESVFSRLALIAEANEQENDSPPCSPMYRNRAGAALQRALSLANGMQFSANDPEPTTPKEEGKREMSSSPEHTPHPSPQKHTSPQKPVASPVKMEIDENVQVSYPFNYASPERAVKPTPTPHHTPATPEKTARIGQSHFQPRTLNFSQIMNNANGKS